MKLKAILTISLLTALICLSCGYTYTYYYDFQNEKNNHTLSGWEINYEFVDYPKIDEKKDIYITNGYIMEIKYLIDDYRKLAKLYDPVVDTIKIRFPKHNLDTLLCIAHKQWMAYSSEHEIRKLTKFEPVGIPRPDSNKMYSLIIPKDEESLIISYEIKLYESVLDTITTKYASSIKKNALKHIDSTYTTVLITDTLLLKKQKDPYPKFMESGLVN